MTPSAMCWNRFSKGMDDTQVKRLARL